MLQKIARDFLEKECPKALVRAMEERNESLPHELWRKMAEVGWQGLAIPEEYGGSEGGFLDLAILLEEMGRALLPGPFFSTVLCGLAILEAGSQKQKKTYLPGIASGETIMAFALTEDNARFDAAGITCKATQPGHGYLLQGTKLFVPDASVADYLLVAARTKESANAEEGVTLFLVDARSPGIAITPLKTIAGDNQCEVVFDKVRVDRETVLGEVDRGWPTVQWMLERGAVGKCAEMVGNAQKVVEMSVEYAKERVQFGRPIGSFQTIQNRCADMVTDADGARYITYYAAWLVSQGLPAAVDVAVAKAWTSDACRRVCAQAHQLHGGIGFTKDHDLQLFTRRAKAAELAFGDAEYHREMIAQSMGL